MELQVFLFFIFEKKSQSFKFSGYDKTLFLFNDKDIFKLIYVLIKIKFLVEIQRKNY